MTKRTLTSHAKLPALAAALLSCCLISWPAAAQDCEARIGVAGPMTGGGSAWGLAMKAGTEFEAATVNAAGGLPMGNRKCKVTVVPFDGQATAAGGAAASNFFASANVHAVVGPVVSPETTGFKPVAKRHGQINFAASFAADVIGPEFPFAFHQLQAPPVWGPIIVSAAKERFKFNQGVIIGPNDQGGTDAAKALAKIYSGAGVKIAEEYYQRGTMNFGPLAQRIMMARPEVVELAGMPPAEAGLLLKQLVDAGYAGAVGRLGAGAEVIIKSVGGPEKLKSFYWMEHVPMDDAAIRRMRSDYLAWAKTPAPENSLFYTGQIAAEQILRGISRAGSDQDAEKIASALRQMTPESRYLGKGGWRGKSQYGINQQLAFPVGMGVIENGKPAPMVRQEIASE